MFLNMENDECRMAWLKYMHKMKDKWMLTSFVLVFYFFNLSCFYWMFIVILNSCFGVEFLYLDMYLCFMWTYLVLVCELVIVWTSNFAFLCFLLIRHVMNDQSKKKRCKFWLMASSATTGITTYYYKYIYKEPCMTSLQSEENL